VCLGRLFSWPTRNQAETTHVDASVGRDSDAGSIPAASTIFRFQRIRRRSGANARTCRIWVGTRDSPRVASTPSCGTFERWKKDSSASIFQAGHLPGSLAARDRRSGLPRSKANACPISGRFRIYLELALRSTGSSRCSSAGSFGPRVSMPPSVFHPATCRAEVILLCCARSRPWRWRVTGGFRVARRWLNTPSVWRRLKGPSPCVRPSRRGVREGSMSVRHSGMDRVPVRRSRSHA